MKENWLKDELYRRLSQKESTSDLDQLWEELESKRYPRKKYSVFWIWSIPILLVLGLSFYLIPNHKMESMAKNTALKIERIDVETSKPTTKKEDDLKFSGSNKPTNPNSLNEGKGDLTSESLQLYRNGGSQQATQVGKSEKVDIHGLTKDKERLLINDISGDITDRVKSIESRPSLFSTHEDMMSRLIPLIEKIEHPFFLLESTKRRLDGLSEMTTFIPSWSSNIKNRKNHMIGMSFSYGSMTSNLVGSSSGSTGLFTKEYYNYRNGIEKNQDYLDLSLYHKYFFDNNISIQTGLNYQQYTSKYQVMTIDNSTEIVIDTIEIYIEGDDIVDATLGEIPITTTTKSRSTNYIKYRALRIPILVGYEMNLSDQFSISLSSGVSFGLTMIGESRLSNPDPTIVNYLSLEASGYTRTIMLESVSQLNIGRNFSNDWVASFGLKYNKDITNRLSKEMSANHKFSSFNLMLGLGKRF